MRRSCALTLFAITAWAPDAMAAWPESFPPEAVASHLTGDSQKIVVVAAGEGSSDAAIALVASLAGVSSVKLVMPGDALGDVAALDDKAIVERARSLPIEQVFVVRVFPGAAPSAVVTMYGKTGDTLGGFMANDGRPLEAAATDPSRGVSNRTASVVGDVARIHESDTGAMAKYEEQFLAFADYAAVSSSSGAVVSTWSAPIRGKYREALTMGQFYDIVDRPDLKKKAQQNVRNMWIVAGVSAGVATGGMVLALAHGPSCYDLYDWNDPEMEACEAKEDARFARNFGVGMTLVTLGSVGMCAPIFMPKQPITAAEARRLADEYNTSLRSELGLPDEMSSRFVAPTVHGGVWAEPGGGGVLVDVRF